MKAWEDLYSCLQVHPDAEAEVIQGAYKRLCRKYHPDVNPSQEAAERMQRLNAAYEVLRDPEQRRKYHTEWLRQNKAGTLSRPTAVRERVVYVDRTPVAPAPTPAALQVIRNYFGYISEGQLREAWKLISVIDKQRFSYGSYVEWQESVAALYAIGRYDIQLFKRHPTFRIEKGQKHVAEEFTVSITEKDKRTGQVSTYSFTKFALLESDGWKVYLGYRDLTPLVVKFKTEVSTREEALLLGQWEHYKEHHDAALGLPNRKGLDESLEPELYRSRRYQRPLSLAVMRVGFPDRIDDPGYREHVLKYIGYILTQSVRCVDSVAYLEDNCFGMMLAESDRRLAGRAARRLEKAVRHDVAACFDFEADIHVGVAEYQGQDTNALILLCLREIGVTGESGQSTGRRVTGN